MEVAVSAVIGPQPGPELDRGGTGQVVIRDRDAGAAPAGYPTSG